VKSSPGNRVAPWVRVAILLLGVAAITALSLWFTGSPLPSDPEQALVFQNALLLVVLGSALLEHHFTKPADSAVNSLMGLTTLIGVFTLAPRAAWTLAIAYCTLVFVLSVTCVALSSGAGIAGWRAKAVQFTYRPAIVLGRSRTLFSVIFLFGLWFFYSAQDPVTLALVIFWGLFLAIWPLRVPQLVTAWFDRPASEPLAEGKIIRLDSPDILRVALEADADWNPSRPKVCVLPNGESRWVQPLFSQFNEDGLLATGLLTDLQAPACTAAGSCVVEPSNGVSAPSRQEINEALGGGVDSELVGFVVEGSSIRSIRFQALTPDRCHDGLLVWSRTTGRRVYYQVVAGETCEEALAGDKLGFQVATAVQLGELNAQTGFAKHDWLPSMNSPVFATKAESELDFSALVDGDFQLGVIPRSRIRVGGDFASDYSSHTAILGVTGSGKTELAFDLIRHALSKDIKVVCIDLTAQYQERLADAHPVNLSVNEATATALSKKLFDVEVGDYRGQAEKKALEEFDGKLRAYVAKRIAEFLSAEEGSGLGLIRLEEISNTKATLWITELYMTCLLKYARENGPAAPPILVVVEEAHTVMPEVQTMGLGDYDSRGLVGKIAQIALQGRKYRVGLLVLAQRTATVSKTVLTQCNTIISFACYDDTSLGFLRNVFGAEHVALIPSLPRLHAVAFGAWVRAEQPIVFEVPFDAAKATNTRGGTDGKSPATVETQLPKAVRVDSRATGQPS
jgi:uncharacterized protein